MKRYSKSNYFCSEVPVRRSRFGTITWDRDERFYCVRSAKRPNVGYGGATSLPEACAQLKRLYQTGEIPNELTGVNK